LYSGDILKKPFG